MTTTTETTDPTAAGSGRNATEVFAAKERDGGAVDHARVSAIATDTLHGAARRDPPPPGHLRRVRRAQGVADPGRRGRRVAAVPRRVGRARRRGGRQRRPQGRGRHDRGPVLHPGRPGVRSPRRRCRCATASRARRCCSRAPSPTWTAPRCRTRWSSCGTPTTTASTPSSPRASRSGTCAATIRTGADGRFAFRTIAARAVPDPDRRLERRARSTRRAGTLAARAPAPQGVRARASSWSPRSCTSSAATTSTTTSPRP